MTTQERLSFLQVSLQNRCLGDLVKSLFGEDLAIVRTPSEYIQFLYDGGIPYIKKHSTSAWIEKTVIGFAATYWHGSENKWQEISQRRMLGVLKQANPTFTEYSLDESTDCLERTILAEIDNGRLRIREKILLDRLAEIMS